jgi:hypothetical protein
LNDEKDNGHCADECSRTTEEVTIENPELNFRSITENPGMEKRNMQTKQWRSGYRDACKIQINTNFPILRGAAGGRRQEAGGRTFFSLEMDIGADGLNSAEVVLGSVPACLCFYRGHLHVIGESVSTPLQACSLYMRANLPALYPTRGNEEKNYYSLILLP